MIGSTATTSVPGVGLALLLQQGVAAWLQAVRTCSCPSPRGIVATCPVTSCDAQDAPLLPSRDARADVIPPAQHAEIATLLAGLALSARPVIRMPPTHDGECV